MNETYVHTLRYHYYGRGSRQSRTMFPISYGPFQDDESAREWIRQRGITAATKLMALPAPENIRISPELLPTGKEGPLHLRLTRERQTGSLSGKAV